MLNTINSIGLQTVKLIRQGFIVVYELLYRFVFTHFADTNPQSIEKEP